MWWHLWELQKNTWVVNLEIYFISHGHIGMHICSMYFVACIDNCRKINNMILEKYLAFTLFLLLPIYKKNSGQWWRDDGCLLFSGSLIFKNFFYINNYFYKFWQNSKFTWRVFVGFQKLCPITCRCGEYLR